MALKSRFLIGPDTVLIDPRTGKLTNAGFQFFSGFTRLGSVDRYVTTVDASDLGTAIALVNDLKAAHNKVWQD